MNNKKEKKKSTTAWIASFAGKRKPLYGVSVLLAIFSTACGVIPYILISMIVNALIKGETALSYYLTMCAIIAALFIRKNVFYSISTVCSHNTTFAGVGGNQKDTL